jgi:hypothetical protein
MPEGTGEAVLIRKYLLGDLPGAEIERVEREFFAAAEGPQRVDEVWAVFGELAEEYLGGALSEEEARQFERRLRDAPALREIFENEKALFAYAARGAEEASRPVPTADSIANAGGASWRPLVTSFKPDWLAIAAIIVLIALATWYGGRIYLRALDRARQTAAEKQAQPELTEPRTGSPTQPPPAAGAANDDKLAKEKNSSESATGRGKSTPNAGGSGGNPASILLLASGQRAEQSLPKIEIPAKTEAIELELELADEDCAKFSAEFQAQSGETLERWENLRPRRDSSAMRSLTVRVRANALKIGNYLIRLDCAAGPGNPVFIRNYPFTLGTK